jgi:outer membrane protein OmpA-like peptidoglycan-associated protein
MKLVTLVTGFALVAGMAACVTADPPVARQVRVIAPPRDLPETATASGAPASHAADTPVAADASLPAPAPAPARPAAVPSPAAPPPVPLPADPAPPAGPTPSAAGPAPSTVLATPPPAEQAPATAVPPPRGDEVAVVAAPERAASRPSTPAIAAMADVLYYEPDAYKLASRERALLIAHARRLKASPTLRLLIRAYADGSGPVEYNLALSKKRAETVARFLRAQGVSPEQLEIAYHGAASAGEHVAADDRRVELQYRLR